MIYHDEPTKFDLRKSYSIDESVAKMLGWMQGKIRVETVIQDKYGPIPRHLPHLYSLQYSLEEHLQLLLDRAKHEYNEALQDNEIAELYIEEMNPVDATSVRKASNADVKEKYNEITHWESVAKRALNYKSMIQEELEKNKSPRLEIDQPITDESGIVHIKLNSLNEWAKQFDITIIDHPEGFVRPTQKHQEQSEHDVNKEVKAESTKPQFRVRRIRKRNTELSKLIDSILEIMPNPTSGKVMAELREAIKDPDSCITCAAEDGVQWENVKGITKTLTHKLLAGRIAEWYKLPLA